MKKFRKNNKGFTLVELIIVIAIIAVLAAVAAPQYIKYVERSRNATLEAAASAAIDIAKAEGALGNIVLETSGTNGTITFTNGDIAVDGLDYDNDLADEAAFIALLGEPVDNGATATYVVEVVGDGTTVINAVKGSTWG